MNKVSNKEYIIPIKGMSVGRHHFDFPVGNEFFEEYGNSQILGASLNVKLELEKSSTLIEVRADIEGSVTVECDRCLEMMEAKIETEATLLVKFVKTAGEEDDDEHVGKRIDHVDDAHQHKIEFPSDIPGNRSVQRADDEDEDARDQAHGQRDAGSENDADEVVAAEGIGPEDVRKDIFPRSDQFEFGFPVLEREEVVVAGIHGLSPVDPKLIVIGIRPEHRDENDGKEDDRDDEDAGHGDLVLPQAAESVFPETRARPHQDLLPPFLFGGGQEAVDVELEGKRAAISFENGFVFFVHGIHRQLKSIRGSTIL